MNNLLLPIVAIIGAPNVGKSTLFNCLTRSFSALVMDLPGTTRDRNYGSGKLGEKEYIVVDTGGIGGEEETLDEKMSAQSLEAAREADILLFLVDGRYGCTAIDIDIANLVRSLHKPVLLVVNKIDGINAENAVADFFSLGFGEPIAIAAAHKNGISKLATKFCALLPDHTYDFADNNKISDRIKVAIVGKPNVGKSTLVNRLLGQDRMIVFDAPGTTRDSIFIPLERDGCKYTLIDTAGVRRKARITEKLEKFSIGKTLQAIKASNVVIFLIDATIGIVDQDLNLLNFIIRSGRCLLIAVNKWDGLAIEQKEAIHDSLKRRIHFAKFADLHFISALHGSGVGNLFTSIQKAYNSAFVDLATSDLTSMLQDFVAKHQPPVTTTNGRRIKLRYAHLGGKNPHRIIIHGKQTEKLTESYKRYLKNSFQNALQLVGTPLIIEFKTDSNPYL